MGYAGIENTVVGVEEGVTVDVLLTVTRWLQGAEAASAGLVNRGEVKVLGGDDGIAAIADGDGKGWEGGAAGEGVTALGVVQLGARDALVVVGDLGVTHEDQGGSGVWKALVMRLGEWAERN